MEIKSILITSFGAHKGGKVGKAEGKVNNSDVIAMCTFRMHN